MGADYRFTIVRAADQAPIATFYFNRVKNAIDISRDFATAFRNISCNEKEPTTITVEQLESDKYRIEGKIELLRKEVLEKKLLSAAAANAEVKHDFEDDIRRIEEEITDYDYAWRAYDSLLSIMECLTEDMVIESKDDEDVLAYSENAKGLEGKDSIWLDDVELHAVCFY